MFNRPARGLLGTGLPSRPQKRASLRISAKSPMHSRTQIRFDTVGTPSIAHDSLQGGPRSRNFGKFPVEGLNPGSSPEALIHPGANRLEETEIEYFIIFFVSMRHVRHDLEFVRNA
jgi:hypothetical protein